MIGELAWDTAFFGRKIGKVSAPASVDELRGALAQARDEKYSYLTCRLDATGIHAIQVLEGEGFYLTDFALVLERGVEKLRRPPQEARPGTPEDSKAVGEIAAGLFKTARFYHDPFFTAEEADRFYRAWAENSLKGEADRVFLIDGEGFVTCRMSGGAGDIPLIGVSADHRRKGTGSALMLSALAWFKGRGAASVKVRTQAGNLAAFRFYERLGFKIASADVTMGNVLGR